MIKLKFFTLAFLIVKNSYSYARSPEVLVILSSEEKLELKSGKEFETGFFLNEFVIPVKAMKEAGFILTFANPKGNVPSLDKLSDDPRYFLSIDEYRKHKDFLNKLDILNQEGELLKSFERILKKGLEKYDAIFIPGGHAPMIDLVKNKQLGEILNHFHKKEKPTGLICHGPVALLSSMEGSQKWPYHGYKMTVFSTAEEVIVEERKLGGTVKFYPQNALKRAGGNVRVGPAGKSNVVVDRELITAQNPYSDLEFTRKFISTIKNSCQRANSSCTL